LLLNKTEMNTQLVDLWAGIPAVEFEN